MQRESDNKSTLIQDGVEIGKTGNIVAVLGPMGELAFYENRNGIRRFVGRVNRYRIFRRALTSTEWVRVRSEDRKHVALRLGGVN